MEEEKAHKRSRKRSNNLLLQIRQQMEFYFSDSNLNKDRFLKQQLQQATDGYLPLEMFLKFNKIKAMTEDVSNLAKALSKSQLLQVSEDKLKIRRTTEIKKPTDIDDRTVYVECLPTGVDHDWVREAFSECGGVLYVSLPKYKSSGDIKGFAFVEFDTVESADKACAIMNNPPATAPELVGIFPRAHKEERRLEKQVERLEKASGKRKRHASEGEVNELRPARSETKRRRTESAGGGDRLESSVQISSETENKSNMKNKTSVNSKNISSDIEEGGGDSKRKKKRKQDSSTEENEAEISARMDEKACDKPIDVTKYESNKKPASKKKRKQNIETEDEKKESVDQTGAESKENNLAKLDKKDTSSADNIAEDLATSEKKLKKRRLSEKSDDACDIPKKAKVPESSHNKGLFLTSDECGDVTEEASEIDDKKKKRPKKNQQSKDRIGNTDKAIPELRVISKKDWLLRRSEYLAQQKENMTKLKEKLHCLTSSSKPHQLPQRKNAQDKDPQDKDTKDKSKSTAIELKPGTVIRIVTTEPITRNSIKENLSKFGSIAYVDVIDGTMAAYVRCNDSESAQKISTASVDGYQMMLLSGMEEESYWKKLEADRALKLNSKSRTKRRGRDRVLARADQCQENKTTKHIVFE